MLEAYEFLEMVYKILPENEPKLRRITLLKTIPNLMKLTKDLEELTAKLENP